MILLNIVYEKNISIYLLKILNLFQIFFLLLKLSNNDNNNNMRPKIRNDKQSSFVSILYLVWCVYFNKKKIEILSRISIIYKYKRIKFI